MGGQGQNVIDELCLHKIHLLKALVPNVVERSYPAQPCSDGIRYPSSDEQEPQNPKLSLRETKMATCTQTERDGFCFLTCWT